MKKSLASLALAGALAASAQADLLGFGAGAGMWSATPGGTAQYEGDEFDLKDDTGLSKSTNAYFWAYLEHPIIMLPNIRLEHTAFSTDGTGSQAINFGGVSFPLSQKTDLTLDQLDVVFYYGLPVPLVDINLGFGAKQVDGEIAMSAASGLLSEKTDLSFTLPIVYAGVRFEIPGTPVGLEADMKYIGYDKSSLSDTRIKADWTLLSAGIALAAEAGYRKQAIVIEDISGVDAEADITIDGLFAGLSLRF